MSYLIPKNILLESGLQNMRDIAKRYQKAKIYFHQDLDGVTSAIAMREYLKRNGIETVDAEIIQYGDKEFAVKKTDAKGDVMPVLVDFAHGKPMFVIHTDHHDTQVGVEKDAATSFRHSRSNVETLSQIMTTDVFPPQDIKTISTVDSANFVEMGVKPEDVMRYIFKLDKEKEIARNRMLMGLVTNKLLLAYKNKPDFLEYLVMNSNPSLISIYLDIVKLAKDRNYPKAVEMIKHQEDYVEKHKEGLHGKKSEKKYWDDSVETTENTKYDEKYGIITQYGGGSMFKAGSYDRYTPFKNNPNANFLIIVWPLGLMQSSCNPFQASRSLKGVNLGEIAQEVLSKFESQLKDFTITLDTVKYFGEKHKSFEEDKSVGFTYNDMIALFQKTDGGIQGLDTVPKGASSDYTVERWQAAIKKVLDKPYTQLGEREKKALKLLSISGWDMVQANSGGHKCITNISGLMYFGKEGKEWLNRLGREFYAELKRRIDTDKKVELSSES